MLLHLPPCNNQNFHANPKESFEKYAITRDPLQEERCIKGSFTDSSSPRAWKVVFNRDLSIFACDIKASTAMLCSPGRRHRYTNRFLLQRSVPSWKGREFPIGIHLGSFAHLYVISFLLPSVLPFRWIAGTKLHGLGGNT